MTQDLVDAANALAQVLECENAALSRLDFTAAVTLGQAKEAALSDMTKACSALPPPGRSPLPPALGRHMRRLVMENRRLLQRAITVQTRVVGIIVRAGAPSAAEQYMAGSFKSQRHKPPATALSLGA
jgi:hypothetical protein